MADVQAVTPVVGWGLVGYAGANMLPGFVGRFIPMPGKVESPMMYYGTRLLVAIGAGMAATWLVPRQAARYILAGGLLTVTAEMANQYLLAPMGLQTYLDNEVGTYLPGSEPLGYLSPGESVDDFDVDNSVGAITRLDPDTRF
jgi:hypothetical protein